jgi:3-methyladenine DNA glycosylase AlkD
MNYKDAQEDLRDISNPEIANHSRHFFKTGEGEYGEGDQFLGIRVPNIRKVARRYKKLSLEEVEKLLQSDWHEERLCALIILSNRAKQADENKLKPIFELYLANTEYVNNWDLVDTSAGDIVGRYLAAKDRSLLYELADSESLWERRIAIISTFYYIKNDEFGDTLDIAEILLNDHHDLIHKAVGWMLREVGKRDRKVEEKFLDKHLKNMPRTMLRYAIEKFPEERRKHYLNL